nr:3'-5' exonuclease [Caldimonas tepidiphila]
MLVDGGTLGIIDEYQGFVRPLVHPRLSDFCIGLTGIRQSTVDAAPPFAEAAARFGDWLHHRSAGCSRPLAWWGSWGRYDRLQLERDCARTGTPLPVRAPHINVKEEFAAWRGVKVQGLAKAVDRVGLRFEGQLHCGLDDARMVARVLQRMLADAP